MFSMYFDAFFSGTRIYVYLDPHRWFDKVEGLCGNFNGLEIDDLNMNGESLAENDFAAEWLVKGKCPLESNFEDICSVCVTQHFLLITQSC